MIALNANKMKPMWILTGDPKQDKQMREDHEYPGSPSINLAKAILELCYQARKVATLNTILIIL